MASFCRVFEGDATMRHVEECDDGFAMLLEFSQTARKLFFYSQEPRKKGTSWDDTTKEKYVPHVIEPSIGVDRLMLAVQHPQRRRLVGVLDVLRAHRQRELAGRHGGRAPRSNRSK